MGGSHKRNKANVICADPWFFVRRVQGRLTENSHASGFLSSTYFKVYRGGGGPISINGFISEKTILFKGFRGSNIFQGVPTFFFFFFFLGGGGGVQMLISIETHITCEFLRGQGAWTPYPPSECAHEWTFFYGHGGSIIVFKLDENAN